jgi:hypothetical protein
MLKKSLPFGMITIILLVSLSLMGMAYGAWTQSLSVHGTVTTGTVAVEFANNPYPSITTGSENPACAIGISGPAADTLYFIVGYTYPGYTCTGTFTVKNNSTLPIKLSVNPISFTPSDGLDNYLSVSCPAGKILPGASPVCSVTFAVPPDAPASVSGKAEVFQTSLIADFTQW